MVKGKMWRRLANKISMTIPTTQKVKDENGNESDIVVPVKVNLTGKQIRYANRNKIAAKAPASDLFMKMMASGGYLIENNSGDTIDIINGEEGVVNEAV